MFATISVVLREKTANLLVFIITFIGAAILTNCLNRQKRKSKLTNITFYQVIVPDYFRGHSLTDLSLCPLLLLPHLFLQHITDDIADLLKA